MEKIILAPKQMHKNLLLRYRKEDLFVNPKILTREEFLGKFYGKVTEEGKYKLFSNHDFLYDNLMQLIAFIPYSNSSNTRAKNKMLFNLKQELEEFHFIEKDEFFEQFIKDKEIEIYGYSKTDSQLLSLLNKYNNPYSFKNFSQGKSTLKIKKFSILEDEIFYMLNNISELVDSGTSPNDILIYTSNENALYYIKKYFASFGLKINFPNSQNLYSQESVSTFLAIAKETKSFEIAFGKLDKKNTEIVNLLEELCGNDLNFDKKFDYVSSILRNRKLQNIRYDNAINIIDSPVFEENKFIFIPCFAQNIYPKSYKDTGFVSDADKEELNVLTSLEQCRIENDLSKDFLLTNNRFFLFRSGASFSEKYFPSPFCKSLRIVEEDTKDLPNLLYSKKYGEYRLGIDLDKKRYFLQHSKYEKSLNSQIDIKYRKYDNSYTDADAFEENKELALSYSSANEYFQCPFSYYLNKVLAINKDQDLFGGRFGQLAHAVFEQQYKNDFDFETVFEKERAKYKWTNGEKLFVDRLKNDVKLACDACLLHRSYVTNPTYFTEKLLSTYIAPHTKLTGFADKIIVLDNKDVVVVDYKTNSETFDIKKIEYGLSMQLPTYAYLLSQNSRFSQLRVTGLYINNVINKTFSYAKSNNDYIDSHLKLNGITLADLEAVKRIDASVVNGSSSFIKSIALKTNGEFKQQGMLVGEETLKQLQTDVLNKYLEADRAIRNNEFQISPLFLTSDGPCKYCNHKDICFLRSYQKRSKNDDDDEGDDE